MFLVYTSTYMSLRTERWKHFLDNRRDTAQELEPPRDRRVAIDTFCAVYFIEHGGATVTEMMNAAVSLCRVRFFLNERQT